MPMKVAIDDALIEDARVSGNHETNEAAVKEALKEYIERRKPYRILELFGKIDYDQGYDYKRQRRRE